MDFRELNDHTSNDGMTWPISRIDELIRRLGASGSKYFGVIDLTAGYHQMPLHPESMILTAFITFFGVYEWLRVPMGLKGAPSYFQHAMATVVLAGLIGYICECYLDDIIVHGKTEDEYLENLEKVLKALKYSNITANPKKISSGMTQIEYVGRFLGLDVHTGQEG
jgi:hypothetical protein